MSSSKKQSGETSITPSLTVTVATDAVGGVVSSGAGVVVVVVVVVVASGAGGSGGAGRIAASMRGPPIVRTGRGRANPDLPDRV